MKIINKIIEQIEKSIENNERYEEVRKKASELKKSKFKEQMQYMKKCPICGNEKFFESKGILSYDTTLHSYRWAIKISAIINREKSQVNDYPLHQKICDKCGYVIQYLPFQELEESYYLDNIKHTE